MTQDAVSLRQLFFEKRGKLVDKWEQYLGVYEREFGSVIARGLPVDLLEIGVQNGGSLETWAAFFPYGSTVMGLDIDPKVRTLTWNSPRIETIILDATDRVALDKALGARTFDIVIDDGSHACNDVITTFRSLFDRVRPGGLYVIEDLHASYFPSHRGGFCAQGTSIEFLKHLVDALHADYFDDLPNGSVTARTETDQFNSWISRISFHDSIVIIEKLTQRKTRPYRRIFGGEDDEVFPLAEIVGTLPPARLGMLLAGETAAREIVDWMRSLPIQFSEDRAVLERNSELRRAPELIAGNLRCGSASGNAPEPPETGVSNKAKRHKRSRPASNRKLSK